MFRYVEIRENVSDYRILLDEMTDAVFVISQKGYITNMNHVFCKMMGYSKKDMIGKHFADFVQAGGEKNRGEGFRFRNGTYNRFEFVFVSKNGSELKAMVTTVPVHNEDGAGLENVAIIEDISSCKRKYPDKWPMIAACLSKSEFRVANLVISGKTSKEIGRILCISEKTVETHRRHIRKKLGIAGRKENLFSHLLSASFSD